MAEDKLVLLQSVVPLRQHRTHGTVEQPDGQGGGDSGAGHQPDVLPDQGQTMLVPPQVDDVHILHRPGVLQKPATKAEVGDQIPQNHRPGPRQPDPKEDRNQAVGDGEHHQREHKGLRPKHDVVVQKDGQQPQGGAGPGGDGPPQQGEQEQQQGEVQGEDHQQLERKLHQGVGGQRRTKKRGVDQPVDGHHNGQRPGDNEDDGVPLGADPDGTAGDGHLPLIFPLQPEGDSHPYAQYKGNKYTVEPDDQKVVHSRPSSSMRRSSSRSSRLTPASTREVARAATEPPKSWSSTPRLAWAR